MLTSRTLAAGLGASATYQYGLTNPRSYLPSDESDWHFGEFRGYNLVTVTDPSGHVSHYRFHQGRVDANDSGTRNILRLLYREDGSSFTDSPDLKGKPYEEDQHEGAGTILSRTRRAWIAETTSGGGGDIRFVHLDRAEEVRGTKRATTTYPENVPVFMLRGAGGNMGTTRTTSRIGW